MRDRYGRWGLILFLAAVVLLTVGCDLENLEIGPVQSKEQSVKAGAAEAVRAEIKLGAGDLDIDSGANELMEAEFTYNVEEWVPEVNYTVEDGQGTLLVAQPSVEKKFPFDINDVRYDWDLRFDEEMPLALMITMGAGEGDLELDSLNLTSLDFEGGAGSVEMDLSSSPIQDLAVKMGAGEVDLDLSGRWDQDLAAVIQGGVSSASLRLPAGAGVKVEVNKGLGDVNVSGLSKNGKVYTNAAYGDSAVTLDILIQGGIGSINLEVVE